MVIISEVNALANLLRIAGTFANHVQDGWYKSSAEVRTFRTKVTILRQTHEEWIELVRKFGLSDDLHLSAYVKEAEKILTKEDERASKLEKSKLARLMPRVFPGRLTEILQSMEAIVDASLQQLKARVETNGLLEQHLLYTEIPLPFRRDPMCVPFAESIAEVQTALESVEGSRVVVIYGDGGTGKTSLVKYVALHYDEVRKERLQAGGAASQLFPDGVFYLQCGKGGSTRIKELGEELLESLGFGSAPRADDGSEGYETRVPSRLHRSLRFKLARRKCLIVLDDVHESQVLERLLIPGDAVTYLITSRRRDIWPGREVRRIPMAKPTLDEATKILAMYTERDTELAEDVEVLEVMHSIIEDVDFHPLMLANIGLAMGSTRENGVSEWRRMAKGWQEKLQRTGFQHHPVVYRQSYQFYMEGSMSLMLESLEEGERSLLQLMSLLENERLPEVVVKFFRKSIEPRETELDFRSCVNKLHDKSLLEVYSPHTQGSGGSLAGMEDSRMYFAIHRLRAIYIRRNFSDQLKSMAIRAFGPAHQINNNSTHSWMAQGLLQEAATTIMSNVLGALGSLVIRRLGPANCYSEISMLTKTRGFSEVNNPRPGILMGIVAAMYVNKSVWDVMEPNVHNLLRAPCLDFSIIPANGHTALSVINLVKRAQDKKRCTRRLVELLNPDGEEGWKQKAQHHATKIIVKFICRQELDDTSVAELIKLQNTTTIICTALRRILREGYWASQFVDQKTTFSSVHSETTKSILDHLYNKTNTLPDSIIWYLMYILTGTFIQVGILNYEDEDTIFNIGEALMKMLDEDTNNARQIFFMSQFFERNTKTAFVMGKMPHLGKRVLRFLVDKVTSNQRVSDFRPMGIMRTLSGMKSTRLQILDVSGAVDMLWAHSVPNFGQDAYEAADAVAALRHLTKNLSCDGNLDNLQRIFSNQIDFMNLLNSVCFSPQTRDESDGYFFYLRSVLEFFRDLSVKKEVREMIPQICPKVLEGLQTLECWLLLKLEDSQEDATALHELLGSVSGTRTAVLISSTSVITAATDYRPRGISSETLEAILAGEIRGLEAMEMYKEALDVALDIHFDQDSYPLWHHQLLIFLKAMVEDYGGALKLVNDEILKIQPEIEQGRHSRWSAMWYACRGMLTRLSGGNLAEAALDFDVCLNCLWSEYFKEPDPYRLLEIYHCLRQRGFAKYLSGDNIGAKADAQTALDLELRNLVSYSPLRYPFSEYYCVSYQMEQFYYFTLLWLPTNYLGFVFSF